MANMQCDYVIQVARGSTVNLHITDLDMEISAGCDFDYISVSHIIITRLNLFFIISFFLQLWKILLKYKLRFIEFISERFTMVQIQLQNMLELFVISIKWHKLNLHQTVCSFEWFQMWTIKAMVLKWSSEQVRIRCHIWSYHGVHILCVYFQINFDNIWIIKINIHSRL